jgi:membrane protein implicated in regulation of membrane protease activity
MMIVTFGALALMVGVIAALALESWWILVAVMALHATASAIVVGYSLRQADKTGGKPDPVTEARIEEEGSPRERERMHREALGS